MRFALVSLFTLWGCSFVSAAPVPKERADAEKVVGTWKLTLGSQGQTDVDLELELHQGGKMVIRQRLTNGMASVYEGTYRVVGSEMPYEVKQGTRVKKETLTIKELSAEKLVVIDPDGLKEEFARVKKKEEPKK